jgi:dTDP-4-amino-4,6-dideoxy-D-galactose acyltransferase
MMASLQVTPVSEAPCILLDWDTNFWGFPVAQLVGRTLSDRTYAAAVDWMKQHPIRCLYFLADPEDAATARSAESHGFRIVDERVTLHWFASSHPSPASCDLRADLQIRPSQPEDLPSLRAIASSSHTDTRFFVDTNFPRDSAHELYVQWISNSCRGFADLVLVALLQGEVVGYCSCHLPRDNSDPGRIGLLAVAPHARGTGVARSLVERALAWFVQKGASRVTVVTQDRNLAALRLYLRCGFTIESRQHWYHRWFSAQGNEAL